MISLKESVSEIVDNRGKTCPTAETGMALIATNCVKSDYLYPSKEKVRYINEQTYSEFFRGHPVPGDLIFVTKGSPGQVCMVPDEVDFCIAQDMVALRANPKIIYPKYLFAILRSKEAQFKIRNLHVGSMIPHFKKSDFDKLEIPLVNQSKQQFIGDFYYSISKKIERNTKMNETLEDIAKTLFKSWFIDFDPVRAKAEGKPTGLSKEISDLFPDSFEDSELGEIPKGWGLRRLDEQLELVYGKSLPKRNRKEGKVPVYGSGGLCGNHNEPLFDETSIIVGRKGTIGSLYWVDEPFFPIDTVFYVKTDRSIHYSYYLLQMLPLREMNTDAAVPGLNRNNAYQIKFPSVPEILISRFEDISKPIRERITAANNENKVLNKLRDTLLPKLIYGELRIPDAEKLVEEASI